MQDISVLDTLAVCVCGWGISFWSDHAFTRCGLCAHGKPPIRTENLNESIHPSLFIKPLHLPLVHCTVPLTTMIAA